MKYVIKQFIPDHEFSQRVKWLINLRWVAAVGLFIVITGARFVLNIRLPLLFLLIGNVFLILYNFLFLFYFRITESQIGVADWYKRMNYLVNCQIALDLILLLLLIHFSGGVENPFIFFFVFHMVMASILLSKRAAYLQATFIIILYGLIMGGESQGVLAHYHLAGFIKEEHYINNPAYFFLNYAGFLLTLYITVYLSTTIIQMLRERERDLQNANISLEAQDRIKSEYVLVVSHDIKGSLGAIQSCLRVVLNGLTGAVSEKAANMVARAERRSRSLLRFVGNLHELSEIRAARKILNDKISLSEVINKAAGEFREKIEAKNLTFIMEAPADDVVVDADRVLMIRLFEELIMNAFKYTPAGGTIILKVSLLKSSHSVQVSVEDTGIGIPKEDLPHVFQDFYRARSAKEFDRDGTGLGLSLVKQIAELYNGRIRVDSKKDIGSTFILDLPILHHSA